MSTASITAAGGSAASLLRLDPDLGTLLEPERRELAMRSLQVRVVAFPTGEWDAARLADADPAHFGLVVIEGVLAHEVALAGVVSTELLGPGDVIRPWSADGMPELLPLAKRWNALSPVRLAVLDRRAAAQLAGFPEVVAMLLDRQAERSRRLGALLTIGQLTLVEQRLAALLWHLAERWGRVTADGIIVPLALPHRVLGQLVGARRPTISTSLGALATAGHITRRDDGTWLLREPRPFADVDADEPVRQRRRLIPAPVPGREASRPRRLDELRSAMDAARQAAEQGRRELEALRDKLEASSTRSRQLRHDRQARQRVGQ